MDQEVIENELSDDDYALLVDGYKLTALQIGNGSGEFYPAIMFEFTNSATDEERSVIMFGEFETMKTFGSHVKQALSTSILVAQKAKDEA